METFKITYERKHDGQSISCKIISSVVILYKIDLDFMMNVCIFLVLKSTLGRRLGTDFKDR